MTITNRFFNSSELRLSRRELEEDLANEMRTGKTLGSGFYSALSGIVMANDSGCALLANNSVNLTSQDEKRRLSTAGVVLFPLTATL